MEGRACRIAAVRHAALTPALAMALPENTALTLPWTLCRNAALDPCPKRTAARSGTLH